MNQPDPLKPIFQQTQRYWYVDGLTELCAGVMIALIGLFYLLTGLLPTGPLRGVLTGIGQPVLFIVLAVTARWAVRKLKERITYPRTGMVIYRKVSTGRKTASALTGAGVAIFLGLTAVLTQSFFTTGLAWILTGALAGLLTLIMGLQAGVTRFYILGAATVGMGFGTAMLNLPAPNDAALFLGLLGLGWLISGVVTLIRYLRLPPVDLDEEDSL